MVNSPIQRTNGPWRIVVVGAEDVAQRLRKAGHRVLSLEQLPQLGHKTANAAVVEIERAIDARSANTFRSKLVEPILIHRYAFERASAFLSLRRKSSGEIAWPLFDDVIAHAVERTALMRRIEEEDSDADAPTKRLTLELPVRAVELAAQKRVVMRANRRDTRGGS